MLRTIGFLLSIWFLITPVHDSYAQEPSAPVSDYATAPSHQPDFPLWAYGHITAPFAPADWFPEDHPEMPDIVAYGREDIGMRACAI